MRSVVSLLFALILSACGNQTAEHAATEGFIRLPSPGANMTAAYLSISSPDADRVVAVSVEGAERTEMHIAYEEDGISRMRQVDGYDIVAGGTLTLQPGGQHLMVIGLDEGFVEGAERAVTLTFESGDERILMLPVHRGTHGKHSGH